MNLSIYGHDAQGDGAAAVGRYVESCMALELIRVEEENVERSKRTLVVIGLD